LAKDVEIFVRHTSSPKVSFLGKNPFVPWNG